jgi:hypothetical protein
LWQELPFKHVLSEANNIHIETSSPIDIIVQLKAAGICLKVYVNLKKICPSLDSLNIVGGL